MSISRGAQFIIIASVFFSIINALVKYLNGIPAIEIVFFRSVITLILSYYVIRKHNLKIQTPYTGLLLTRGFAGAIALGLYFYTIQKIPLATAVTLLYLAPIFTVIIAIFFMKEYPTKKQIPFFIISFIGAALLKNFDSRVSLEHFFFGVAAAFFAGIAYNIIRKLKGKVAPHVVIFYFPLVTIPLCLPFLYKHFVVPDLKQLALLISIGVMTQIAQVFMTKAYMLEAASKISHFNYLTCLFAFLTGLIFFQEELNAYSLAGLFLVFVGVYFSSRFAPRS